MYATVRENRTSLLRKLGRPVPHALEHIKRGRTCSCPSPSNDQSLSPRIDIGSKPDLNIPKQRQRPQEELESCTTDPSSSAREVWFAAELNSLNFTIDELKTKLLASKQLVSEQALQLSECSSAQTARDDEVQLLKTQFSKLCQRLEDAGRGLEKANTKVQKHMGKTTFFENELMIARQQFAAAKVEKERHSHAEAQLEEQLLSCHKFQALYSERIENQETDLKQAHETILNQQKQLDRAHAEILEKVAEMEMHSQAEAQLWQQEVRMQQELEQNQKVLAMQSETTKSLENELQQARETITSQHKQHEQALAQINELREEVRAEAQLRQDDEKMQQQLQSTQDLLARRSEMVKILEDELESARKTINCLQKQHESLPEIKALQLRVAKMEKDSQAEAQMRLDNDDIMEIMKVQLQSNKQFLSLQSEEIHKLERNRQDLSEKLMKKDVIFTQVRNKLAARKEEYLNLFEIVKDKEKKVISREYRLKLLEEQSSRSSSVRAELEKRIADLEEEIARLKHDLDPLHKVRDAST